LVKRYSHERYDRRKLTQIGQALRRQMRVYEAGVPCPRIWRVGENILRRPSEEIDYMVMEFLPGLSAGPDSVNLQQMEALGAACARMHEAFRKLPSEDVEGFPLNGQRFMDVLCETVRRGREECPADAPEEYREAIAQAEKWADKADLSFLNRLERGIAHEDFTPDNMLFSETGFAAILDFDRNRYSFPLHDVGRILLSLALHDGKIDGERVRSFRQGYANLKDEDIYDAFSRLIIAGVTKSTLESLIFSNSFK
jgi:Ser/Thr protein kinase RdoA (MazF antagonist)